MKKIDKRNLTDLMEVFDVGERLSARQALDRLIDYRIEECGNLNQIPHINRLSAIMRISGRFITSQGTLNGVGGRTFYERAF